MKSWKIRHGMEKKVIVTGASGLLGRAIYRYLKDDANRTKYPVEGNDEFKWNCLGLCFSRVKGDLKPLDLNDFDKVDSLLDEFKPDAIIHSAAEKRVEKVEKEHEKATHLNVDVTGHLAQACANRGIMFVYISTDYVFDGMSPPYKIDSQPNPLNKYGLSKLQGEQAALNASPDSLIVRVPVLYGHTEVNRYDESAINVLVEKIKKAEPFLSDSVQIRYPTHVIDVARFCCRLMIRWFKAPAETRIRGIFHCSAPEAFTKHEMSCVIADLYQVPKEIIQADTSAADVKSGPNLRPQNAKLDTKYSFELVGFETIMRFKESIKDCLEKFVV